MTTRELRHKIAHEQANQQLAVTTALLVTIFAVISMSILPQMLYEYILANAAVEQQMMVLKYIPIVGYGLSVLYFVSALLGNYFRGRRIRLYQQELQLLAYTEDEFGHWHEEVTDEEMMAEEEAMDLAADEAEPVKKPRRNAAKKSSKKTSKKK